MKALLLIPALVLSAQESAVKIRTLGRTLESMPAARDLTTPEGAYAAMLRAMMTGAEDLYGLFGKALQSRLPKKKPQPQSEAAQAATRAKRLEEVHELGDGAAVIVTRKIGLGVRYLVFEEGRWANLGEDDADNLETARKVAFRFLVSRPRAAAATAAPSLRVIGKTLSEMPPGHDASTPEGAYAGLTRATAVGTDDLRPFFASKVHARLPKNGLKPRSEPGRSQLLALRIEEVHQLGESAAVIGRKADKEFDLWFLEREEGRWVLLGNDTFPTIEAARSKVQTSLAALAKPAKAAPVANPDAHLAGFVTHLQKEGREPKELLLEAMKGHRLTGLGEIHNRPRSWAAYQTLVADPRFAQRVGTIYVEHPRNGQPLMDQFLASKALDVAPLLDLLRTKHDHGWPDQAMVDFFATLWKVNQALPEAQRVRVRLVDQPWEWTEVRVKEDLKKLVWDRDELMAGAILEDLARPGDGRNGVFIVGYLHLLRGRDPRQDPRVRFESAGERIRQKLGSQLFTVMQHGPVMTNNGMVSGRVQRGLFDEAFGRCGDRPMAFPLGTSPFGKAAFDCSPDTQNYTGPTATYGGIFDAYLYLGPLETETFSPLVPGFYTDAYAQEVDRRYQLSSGTGVKEAMGLKGSGGADITEGLLRVYGRPMPWVAQLGPREAWRK
jgi:hypothetical protein